MISFNLVNLPIVILLDEVVTSTECDQVGVVSRSRDGHGTSAANVGVAKLISQALKLI